nr:hydrin 1 [Xenopus laevis]
CYIQNCPRGGKR